MGQKLIEQKGTENTCLRCLFKLSKSNKNYSTGPLLLVIYANDLPGLELYQNKFVDEAKLRNTEFARMQQPTD